MSLLSIVNAYPRRPIIRTPSPVNRLINLEKALGGKIRIYIKRDDMFLPFCGNKLRYIEYVLGAYDAVSADCILHCGGLTSNYMTQLAMVGAMVGVPVHLLLLGDEPKIWQGNLLLQGLFGATLHFRKGRAGVSCSNFKQELAKHLRRKGRKPFSVDYPFSNHSAILGYMRAWVEWRAQVFSGLVPDVDQIHLCSAGNSYLGLKIAADLDEINQEIVAYSPIRFSESGLNDVAPDRTSFLCKKAQEFANYIGKQLVISDVKVDEGYVGAGYAIPSAESLDAVKLVARTEGILLDPIYTGKAMAGLIDKIRSRRIPDDSRVLFIHTGGMANVFGYNEFF